MTRCKHCDNPISVGSEAIELEGYADGIYCCKECAKSALSEALDEIYDDISSDVVIEDEDPYARYGVSRGDFF